MTDHMPHVVIVGGGFGGLAAAKALAKAPAHVTLIDRNNHHVFQPLHYQVATSVLTPGQIGAPIRGILAKELNVTVILGEVIGVAGVGLYSPSIPRPRQHARERLPSMDVDLFHRLARLAAHRGPLCGFSSEVS